MGRKKRIGLGKKRGAIFLLNDSLVGREMKKRRGEREGRRRRKASLERVQPPKGVKTVFCFTRQDNHDLRNLKKEKKKLLLEVKPFWKIKK